MLAFLEGPDLLVVLALVVLLFGGSKIPQLARSLGEAQREFRKAAQPDAHAPPDREPTARQPGADRLGRRPDRLGRRPDRRRRPAPGPLAVRHERDRVAALRGHRRGPALTFERRRNRHPRLQRSVGAG